MLSRMPRSSASVNRGSLLLTEFMPIVEQLELRLHLSAATGEAAFLDRLRTHTATEADLAAHELTALNINGDTVYARTGEWIANLNLSDDVPTAEAAVRRLGLGARVKKTLGRTDVVLIHVPPDVSYARLHAQFDRLDLGSYIEPNGIVLPATTEPSDPLYEDQWGLPKISAPLAWDVTTGNTNVVMAVFDRGVDYTHDDLTPNMWTNPGEVDNDDIDNDGNGYIDDVYGYDFGNNDGDPGNTQDNHGTLVAGVLGARGQTGIPGIGIAGVNWTADIMAIKIYSGGQQELDFISAIVAGLHYVVDMKARGVNVRITNHSYELETFYQSLQDAITLSEQHGILVVASAGNHGHNLDTTPRYPAAFPSDNIIAVAATNESDELAAEDGDEFDSSYGATTVDLGAPGVRIVTTELGDDYVVEYGTSLSAPFVAGVAGLAFSLYPNISYRTVKNAILGGVDRFTALYGKVVSGGRLNADTTLDLLALDPVIVPGTSGNDTIVISAVAATSTELMKVKVLVNNQQELLEPHGNVPTLIVNGGDGNDSITIQDYFLFPTVLNGGNGNDTLIGAATADQLNGDAGTDSITGGAGDDTINGGDGVDTLKGEAGNDTLDYSTFTAGVTINLTASTAGPNGTLDSVPNVDFEGAIGGSGNDVITGNLKPNVLDGRGGADTIDGDDNGGISAPLPDGFDSILGGDGNDSIIGDGGDDTIDGQAGNDSINGGPGHDWLTGGTGTDLLLGDSGNDHFFAFDGSIDTLYGGSGTDTAVIDEEDDDIPLDDIENLINGS